MIRYLDDGRGDRAARDIDLAITLRAIESSFTAESYALVQSPGGHEDRAWFCCGQERIWAMARYFGAKEIGGRNALEIELRQVF